MRVLLGALMPFVLASAAACGPSISTPEDLPITVYPKDQPFRLTVVMESCSDACAKYSDPECDVSVDREKREIRLDASVGFDRESDACGERCGPSVLAHCDVPALASGTYSVSSGSFSRQITVR